MVDLRRPIGRAVETSLLADAIAEVQEGQKRAILLHGSPGMGKTTLLRWTQEYAELAGLSCATSRGVPVGGLHPRFLLLDLLEGLGGARKSSSTNAVQAGREPALVAGELEDSPDLDVLRIARELSSSANHGVVGLFIDDIQWVPQNDMSLLFASVHLSHDPVLLVLTERTGTSGNKSRALPPDLTADIRVTQMEVVGLGINSVTELAHRILGSDVLPSLGQELFRRTLGNALYITETLMAWRSNGDIAQLVGGYWGFADSGSRPDARPLVEMIARRLRPMDTSLIRLATGLAILGRSATIDELAQIVGSTTDSITSALSRLDEAGLVSRSLSNGTYALSHPLYQSALVEELNQTNRAMWHGVVYRALASHPDCTSSSELAYHAVNGLEQGPEVPDLLRKAAKEANELGSSIDASRWYEHLTRASDSDATLIEALSGRADAVAHFDPEHAVDLYTRAISISPSGPSLAKLYSGRALALRRSGRTREALVDYDRAVEFAGENDLPLFRDHALIARVSAGERKHVDEEWTKLADTVRGTPLFALIQGHSGLLSYVTGDLVEAKRRMQEALRESTDAFGRRSCVLNLAWFLCLLGKWNDAQRMIDEVLDDARQANDLWTFVPTLTTAAILASWKGDLDKAIDLGAQGLAISRHYSDPVDVITCHSAYATALLAHGNVDEAIELLRPAMAIIETIPERIEVQPPFFLLAEAYARLGEHDNAAQWSAAGRKLLSYNLTWVTVADRVDAQLCLARKDFNGALEIGAAYGENPSQLLFEQAQIHEISARAFHGLRRRADASNQARLARDIYACLGAACRLEEIDFFIEDIEPRLRGRPRSKLPDHLTDREFEIVGLVAQGMTNKDIAQSLFLSMGTVKKHIENAMKKLGIRTRTGLASYAYTVSRPEA